MPRKSIKKKVSQEPFRFLDLPRELRDKVYSNFFQGFDELNGSERRSCTSLLYVSRQMHSEARQALTRAYLFVHIMIMDVADLVDDVFKRFLDGAIVSDTVSMTPLSGLSIMISNPNTKRRDEKIPTHMMLIGMKKLHDFCKLMAGSCIYEILDLGNPRMLKYSLLFNAKCDILQERKTLSCFEQCWLEFPSMRIHNAKDATLSRRVIDKINGPAFITEKHFLDWLRSVHTQGVHDLLALEYDKAQVSLLKAADMAVIHLSQDNKYVYSEKEVEKEIDHLTFKAILDCAIAHIGGLAQAYESMWRMPEPNVRDQRDEILRLMQRRGFLAHQLLLLGLKFVSYAEDTAKAKGELYCRQFVMYIVRQDIARAQIALRAAKTFAPSEQKVRDAEDLMRSCLSRGDDEMYIATGMLMDAYLPSNTVTSLVSTADVGWSQKSRSETIDLMKPTRLMLAQAASRPQPRFA